RPGTVGEIDGELDGRCVAVALCVVDPPHPSRMRVRWEHHHLEALRDVDRRALELAADGGAELIGTEHHDVARRGALGDGRRQLSRRRAGGPGLTNTEDETDATGRDQHPGAEPGP